jgi:hypothetical protein
MVSRRDVQVDRVQSCRLDLDKYLVAGGWRWVGAVGSVRCGAEFVDHCRCSFPAVAPCGVSPVRLPLSYAIGPVDVEIVDMNGAYRMTDWSVI